MEYPNNKDESNTKPKNSEIEEVTYSKWFVYTISKVKKADIPEGTLLTHLRVVDSAVTEIPAEAFSFCEALVHVQLPDTLTNIGCCAFAFCSQLKLVQFVPPSNNKNVSLQQTSSSTCKNPTNILEDDGLIVFPATTAKLLQIDNGAFGSCTSLRKVIICSASTKLGRGVFQFCRGLISVELPDGLRVIAGDLFWDCDSLATVKIPSSVDEIGVRAFNGCRSLTSVDLIGKNRQEFDSSIENLLHIPAAVYSIGKWAFAGCSGLKYINLPRNLERIEDFVFYGCTQLEYIEIPSTVSFIGPRAFRKCDSLSHIRVPTSVETIAEDAFLGCSSLISIELPEEILIGHGYDAAEDERLNVLVNLAIPTLPEDDEVVSGLLYNKSKLGSVVDDEGGLLYKLKYRFDDSLMNELCYYQSYHSSEDIMLQVRSLMEDDPLAATTQVDEFSMTPLHVLSLSQTPNLDMLLALMNEGNPNHLVHSRDLFGSTPLDYLCLNRMPNSTAVIRRVLYSRFDYLLGLNRSWNSEMLQAIEEALAVEFSSRRRDVVATYLKLANYELKVIFSLLELRLWKSGGTSVVLDNVLLFLDTLDVEDYFSQ
eukprot:scaffold10986_cov91-Cylindrotheca_fusiformis.AAC.1